MVMCSNCHKRVAVVFLNKIEKGERTSQGLCIKCAKDMGIPIDNMMGDIYQKMGITPEQIEGWEESVYYDLMGRRVLNLTNGIYIVNGKKVVIE